MITYRLITEQQDFAKVPTLEKIVWDMDALDVISPHLLQVIKHTGGSVIGAFDTHEQLVGCTLALAMKDEARLWSHFAAVHPAYQRQGIGYGLKQTQREWALANGYTHISWTFAPLIAANANFNFHVLGVRSQQYHINFYGEMTDAINVGIPSDRFEVSWSLQDEPTARSQPPASAPFLIINVANHPQTQSDLGANWHFVEIPRSLSALQPDIIMEWAEAIRTIMCAAFQQGYQVVDFVRQDDRNWYVLQHTP